MKREHWGSRMAFVLAAAGSAVGLGNIWKFPYLCGKNGGGAFILMYLLCVIVVGLPIMLAELVIGRTSQRDVVGSFKALAPRSAWVVIGVMGLAAGFIILSFYSVVAGWSLEYLYQTIAGSYWGLTPTQISARFGSFIQDYHWPLIWHFVFMGLCIGVVASGVKDGIERWSKILMPTLFALLLMVVVKVATLPGAGAGYRFLFTVDWSKVLHPEIVLQALGQAFFSLSLGMGAMITYGSYLSKEERLPVSAGWVVLADTSVALLAGLAIFPAVFAFGQEPTAGPGLVFCILPSVFAQMAAGRFFGSLFFFALLIAALTSAISLLEVVVAYFVDEKGWSRVRTTIAMAVVIAILGIPAALSCAPASDACPLGLADFKIWVPGGRFNCMDFAEHVASNLLLPLGGLLMCIFVGWSWGERKAVAAVSDGASWFSQHWLARVWIFLLRYVSPILVAGILAYSLKIVSFVDGRLSFFHNWF